MSPPITLYRGSYLIPHPAEAVVADVMHRGVVACDPDVTVRHVAEAMAAHHVHAVVVEGLSADAVHGERLIWAVVSDRDVARAFALDRDSATAADIAATEPVTVAPEDTLADAAEIMEERGVSHLIVTSSDGRPRGVVSTLDIARALAWGGEARGG
jgi:crotonyl-CoA carboxylase/reductase